MVGGYIKNWFCSFLSQKLIMPLRSFEVLLLCWSGEIRYHYQDEREFFDYTREPLDELEVLLKKKVVDATHVLVVLVNSSDQSKSVISVLPKYFSCFVCVVCDE